MATVVGQMQARSITMEKRDWAVVRQVSQSKGLVSRSAGVRFIIRDWQQLRGVDGASDEEVRHGDR